jgi:quinone-modifying oxidoreductase, subunit QmoC
MAIRANPKLIDELEAYGAQDVSKCYHCGNCSATCPFSQGDTVFPRRAMRQLQMGLESKLESSLDPWLCYYCGECTDDCPRDAEPGETMMSLRRWLTARYDWTGISRLFYRSWKAELTAVLIVALLTGVGFLLAGLYLGGGDIGVYNGENAFLPAGDSWYGLPAGWGVHAFDWILAGVLVFFLGSNCVRMWWKTMGRNPDTRWAVGAYVRKLWVLPAHFMTQMRYAKCERKRPWAVHLALMLSYVTMLVLIMFFLGLMASGPDVDWRVHVFGLAAAVGLLATTIWAMRGRVLKTETQYKHSHESDWMFLILLLVVAATGIVQFALHRAGLDAAANVAYIVHLMGVVPMLALEVPFSKWSHLAYRPLAMYFADVRAEVEAVGTKQKAAEPLGAPQTA